MCTQEEVQEAVQDAINENVTKWVFRFGAAFITAIIATTIAFVELRVQVNSFLGEGDRYTQEEHDVFEADIRAEIQQLRTDVKDDIAEMKEDIRYIRNKLGG